jgi:hypothetical protein
MKLTLISTFTDWLIDVLYPKSEVVDYDSIRSILREKSEGIIKDSEIAQIEIGQSEFYLKIKNKLVKAFSGAREKELMNTISFLGWWGVKEFTMEDLINIAVHHLKKNMIILLGGYIITLIILVLFGTTIGLLSILIWTFIIKQIIFGKIFGNINFFQEYYNRLKDEDTLFAPTVMATLSEPSIMMMIKKMASGLCGSISHEIKSFAGLPNSKEIFNYWSASHPVTGLRYLESIVSNENEFKNIISKLKMSEVMMNTISEELKSLFTRMASEMKDKLAVGGTMTAYVPLMVPLLFGLIGMGASPLLFFQIPLVWIVMRGLRKNLMNSEARYLICQDKFLKEIEIAKEFAKKYFLPLTIIGMIFTYTFCKIGTGMMGLISILSIPLSGIFFALSIIIIYAGIMVDKIPFVKPTEYIKNIIRYCNLLKNPPKKPGQSVAFKGIDGEYNLAVAVAGEHSDFPEDIKKILVRSSIEGRAEEKIMEAGQKMPPLARPFMEGLIPILKMDNIKLGDEVIKRSKILTQYMTVLSEIANATITWETIEAYITKRSKWVCTLLGIMMGILVVIGSMLDGILMILFQGFNMNISAIFKGIAYVFEHLGSVLPTMAVFCGLGVGVGVIALCNENRLTNLTYGIVFYILAILGLSLVFKLAISMVGDVSSVFQELATTDFNTGFAFF